MGFNWDSAPPVSTSNRSSWQVPPDVQADRDVYAQTLDNNRRVPIGSVIQNPMSPDEVSADNIRRLMDEITNARNPQIRAILEAELKNEQQKATQRPVTTAPNKKGFSWDDGSTGTEVPSVEPPPKKSGFSLGKELSGMATGALDLAAGLASFPLSGLIGGADALIRGSEQGAKTVGKVQEMLSPSAAMTKLGVPPEFTTATGTHDILMKIISAPHEYISKPISDKYFELTGRPLSAAVLQGVLDIPAYFLAFKGGKAVAEAGARPRSAETLRQEAGYVKDAPPEFKAKNVTPEGFAPDLPFGEQRIPTLPPYDILPEAVRRQLEAELNPPLEQRVPGQGELFTGERPYAQGELIQGRPVTTEGGVTPRTAPEVEFGTRGPSPLNLPYDVPGRTEFQYGDRRATPREPVQLPLEERPLQREQTPIETIPLDRPQPLTDRGSVGEQRARVAEENQRQQEQTRLTEEGIPYQGQSTLPFRGPGSRQRGAIGYLPERNTTVPIERQRDILKREEKAILDSLTRNRTILSDLEAGALSKVMQDYLSREKISPMQLRQETKKVIDELKADLEKTRADLKEVQNTLSRPSAEVKNLFGGPGKRQRGWIKFPGGTWDKSATREILNGLLHNRNLYLDLDGRVTGSDLARFSETKEMIDLWKPKIETYLKKYAGTQHDPLNSIIISPAGKRWEQAMDAILANLPDLNFKTGDYPNTIYGEKWDISLGRSEWTAKQDFSKSLAKDKKWIKHEELSHPTDPARAWARNLHEINKFLAHVYDYSILNIPKDKFAKMTFVDLVKETVKADEKARVLAEKQRAIDDANLTTFRSYPDNSRWVQLDRAGQFAAESDMMGHSVRGYEPPKGHPDYVAASGKGGNDIYGLGGWEAIKSGKAQVYSFRGPDKKSVVTVEVSVTPEGLVVRQIKGPSNAKPADSVMPQIHDLLRELNPNRILDYQNANLLESKSFSHEGQFRGTSYITEGANVPLTQLPPLETAPYRSSKGPPVGPGRRQGGWIGSFDRTSAKKGMTAAILDARRIYREETRPLAEVVKEMAEQNTPDLEATNLANFGIPKQVSYLSRNPIVKWAADNLLRIDRETHNQVRNVIEGENFKTNSKGIETRALDETIGLGLFHKYAKDKNRAIRGEMSEMTEINLNNIGKAPLTRESFRTERQWQTFQAIQAGYRKMLDDFNKAREAAGHEPTQPINNYSPFILEGDYRIWAKDKEGKTVGIGGVNYSWQAKQIVKLFKQKFPDAVVSWEPSRKTRYDMSDLSGFHEAMKIMETEGNPKLSAAFSRIYADIMAHRGAGKRALHRTGVAGPINFLKGDKGLAAYEHAYTSYANSIYRYIGNIKKSQLKSELIKLDKATKESQKNAIDYSNQIIDAAKGKALKEDWIGDALGAFTEKPLGLVGSDIGLGRNFPSRFISGMSALVLPYLLTTGRMMISQMVQPGANLAKLSKLKEIGDVSGNPALLLMDGYNQLIKPDKIAIEARNWAMKEGYTNPTIVSYFDRTIGNLPTQVGKQSMHALKKMFAGVEQLAVRLPSFLAYEKALREKIPNKQERFEYAAKVMDDTVVNYSEVNMPLIYNKMGIIGQAGKGLKQYAHNIWGHFLDYSAFAKDTGKVAPLGWFLGNTLMVAGLKGMPLVAEAAAFIALYNLIAGDSVPEPEKAMWEASDKLSTDYPETVLGNKKLHQALIQGGLSTTLRYDVSSSVAHPGLPQMFSFPALAMTERMFKDSLEFLYKYFKGTATDMDSMKAALSLMPNAGTGFIEELYTEEGGMTPNPNRNMEGVYRRDDVDKFMAYALSLRHVDEAKKRAIVQGARLLIKQDMAQKLSAIDAITDRIANGEEVTPEIWKQFLSEGGNPQTLTRTIKKRLEDRMLDPTEQLSRGRLTPEKYHKLMRMKELLDSGGSLAPAQESKPEDGISSGGRFQWDNTDPKSELQQAIKNTEYGVTLPSYVKNSLDGSNARSERGEYYLRNEQREGYPKPKEIYTNRGMNMLGVVRRNSPHERIIDAESHARLKIDPALTSMHEASHQDQLYADPKRTADPIPLETFIKNPVTGSGKTKNRAQLLRDYLVPDNRYRHKGADAEKVEKEFQKTWPYIVHKYGLSSPNGGPRELLAELKSWEGSLPKGKTIFSTDVWKDMEDHVTVNFAKDEHPQIKAALKQWYLYNNSRASIPDMQRTFNLSDPQIYAPEIRNRMKYKKERSQ